MLKLWDIRMLNFFLNYYMGYNGLIFVIDWYFEEKIWVVFVGRDKMVKVMSILNFLVKFMFFFIVWF